MQVLTLRVCYLLSGTVSLKAGYGNLMEHLLRAGSIDILKLPVRALGWLNGIMGPKTSFSSWPILTLKGNYLSMMSVCTNESILTVEMLENAYKQFFSALIIVSASSFICSGKQLVGEKKKKTKPETLKLRDLERPPPPTPTPFRLFSFLMNQVHFQEP